MRIILKRCFDLESYSVYSDEEFPSAPVRELVGESPVGLDAHNFVQSMSKQGRTMCVKTHEFPGHDAHRAIYIVRDGRAALVSYCHYLRDFWERDISIEVAIFGGAIPSWSAHVAAWALSRRPDVLIIRYEELIMAKVGLLEKLSSFIRRPILRPNDIKFSDLNKLMPTFFRRGSNECNVGEMTQTQLELFHRHHGSIQTKLGYPGLVPLKSVTLV